MDNYGLLFSKSLGGGGGSGTDNYNELSNKPQINSVTLSGNKSLDALGIQPQLTFDTEPTEDSTNPVESGGVYSALASKQDTLTIDATPTENSSNPVQSGGTYTALAGKQDTLTFDDSPTSGSSNPVKSGGVYSALSDKQDTLTFEGTYNASSNKAATESTVSDAIKALDVAGASGIAASKTISAWSETDGKASISTQDIAIAGTQAVLTGYTPESPSQTDSILATDTVNAAIKKLDERSRVDENNILSITPYTKTVADSIAAADTYQTISGIEITLPAGKTVHVSASGYWNNGYCKGIEIYRGDTLQNSRIIGKNETETGYLALTATALYKNVSNADETIHLAAKQSSTGANTYSIFAVIS